MEKLSCCPIILLWQPTFHCWSNGSSWFHLSLNGKFKPQPNSNPYAQDPPRQYPHQKIVVTMFPLLPTLCFGTSFPAAVLWCPFSSPPKLALILPQTAAAIQKASKTLMFFISFRSMLLSFLTTYLWLQKTERGKKKWEGSWERGRGLMFIRLCKLWFL